MAKRMSLRRAAGFVTVLMLISLVASFGNTLRAESELYGVRPESARVLAAPLLPTAGISPFALATGRVSLSVDGLGTLNSTGIIQVEKPAGATVRNAYLIAGSTGWYEYEIPVGGILIDGANFPWLTVIPSDIYSYNHLADVTAIVQSKLNSAPPGLVNFTITEQYPVYVDGELLAVIFDDPNVPVDQENTIALLFGAQKIAGDDFFVTLSEPIDKSDPDLVLNMSLGISYSYQCYASSPQTSNVDVNGVRLTSSAGGNDEGGGCNYGNGALFTVGGLGDTNDNPPPYALPNPSDPTDPDDELYDLIPFVSDGDYLINIHTINPSNDDNILFAAFELSVRGAVVTECLVEPPSLDFGTVALGSSTDRNFTITNKGNVPLSGYVTESCPYYSIVSGGGAFTLDPDGSVEVTVRFEPTVVGTHVCTIELGDNVCNDVECSGTVEEECLPPILSLLGYRTVSWASPLWTVQVEVRNAGPGVATNVNVMMNEEIPWLTIPDPNCSYGDIPEGGTSYGNDTYTFDLTNSPGGSFNAWFDVTYEDECGNPYRVRLDPEFDSNNTGSHAIKMASFRLDQNYPNPFNPNTTICYELPIGSRVALSVYDVSGKLVRTLVDAYREPGLHAAQWDGKDSRGNQVASGIYFSKLRAGTYQETRRMVLLR